MAVRALVFDFDGLILDTEGPEYHSVRAEFEAHGADLPLEDWLEIVGTADHVHWYDWLDQTVPMTLPRGEVIERRRVRHHALIAEEEIRPGVVALLEEARRHRLAVTAASSSPRDWVEGHLRRLGLWEYFHAIRCRDDVARGKPAPDVYLAALEAVGVEAGQAIAFEDSHHGSQAAKAAGIYTVVVPNDLTRTQRFDHADLVLTSLLEFRLLDHVDRPI
jgi:HAD superfamily hydrolase (TIGR01509 family)